MALRLIIGRSGSGKTHHCRQEIIRELLARPIGPPIYLLVPRQASFTAQREIACSGQVPGFCRLEVMSIEQLAEKMLGGIGGAAIPSVDSFGRQMILGHILRKHAAELRFFGRSAHQAGLPALIEATLGEFQRCGKSPEDLAALASAGDGAFSEKLADIALIYRAYEQFIGQDRVDPRRRIAQVLDRMEEAMCLSGGLVFVDGYYDFAEPERRMLARIGRLCTRVDVTLLLDPQTVPGIHTALDDLSPLHRIEYTCQSLLRACADEGVTVERAVLLPDLRRFANTDLLAVEHRLLDSRTPPAAGASAVRFVQAPNRRQEAEHAALHIRDLLCSGYRLRDIVVLVRSLEGYRDLIRAAFVEHHIPFFADHRRSMAHHPLMLVLRGVLAIALRKWEHDAVMTVIKTGLAGLSLDEADALENYVLQHRLRGSVWTRTEPWHWRRQPAPDEDVLLADQEAAAMEVLRQRVAQPISTFIASLQGVHTLREMTGALFTLLDALQVRQALGGLIASAREREQHELADEHQQAWESMTALFDQLIDLLGNEPASLEDFVRIVESGLEHFDLALAPPAVDEVLVGQVDRTFTGDVRAALVLGLNEGVFPRIHRDESILSDAERLELRRRNFEIEPASERRVLNERFLGYLAFTRASHSLYLSRATADDAGRALGPSAFWDDLRQLLPDAPLLELSCNQADPAAIASPRRLVTGAAQWARANPAFAGIAAWPVLYQYLAETGPALPPELRRMLDVVWPSLSYTNDASLAPATAAALFPAPVALSARQVETFATCPYRHFARYGLQLAERVESPLAEVNLDQAYHDILESLVQEMRKRSKTWQTLDDWRAKGLAARLATRVAEALHRELQLGKGRNDYLAERIARSIDRILSAHRIVATRSTLGTQRGAVAFGPSPAVLPPLAMETPGGRRIELEGRIDRVDLVENADSASFAVLDYRLGQTRLELWQVREGLALQLLTQMLAVRANAREFSEKPLAPAAALCIGLLEQIDEFDHPDQIPAESDPTYYLRNPRRGVFDKAFLGDLDSTVPAGQWSPVVSAKLNKDGSPGLKRITDFVENDELDRLLNLTEDVIARLADRIADGEITVRPYRIGTAVPCSTCGYRSVCRFDPAVNHYNILRPLPRDQFLADLPRERNGGAQ